jgi:phosphoribosylformylglycinamidine cyclo-ligase
VSRLLDQPEGGLTYAEVGVSIEAGDDFVQRIKDVVASTARPEVLGGIGGFGGLFHLNSGRYHDPVIVSSADGVGTKLEIARHLGRYGTVGIDLVAMLVDDLVCSGAEPLFMLDYVAVGQINLERLVDLVAGIAEGCRQCGTALLGGETAEHAGVMRPDDLDVAGFAVGVVERGDELGAHRLKKGDALIGFGSPGLRSNGYSLARRVLVTTDDDLHAPAFEGAERSLGEGLHAAAHITGGGIVGNVVRVLPPSLDAVIHMDSFETPEIFYEIQRRGLVSAYEMVRVFNCGLGMVVCVDADDVDDAINAARSAGVVASVVGHARPGSGQVVLT